MIFFRPHAPEIIIQDDVNTFCFNILSYDIFDAREYVLEQAILS